MVRVKLNFNDMGFERWKQDDEGSVTGYINKNNDTYAIVILDKDKRFYTIPLNHLEFIDPPVNL